MEVRLKLFWVLCLGVALTACRQPTQLLLEISGESDGPRLLRIVRAGLLPAERRCVQLDGKFIVVSVDETCGNSLTMVTLRKIRASVRVPIRLHLVAPELTFDTLISTNKRSPGRVVLEEIANYVSTKQGVPGQTLLPIVFPLQADLPYSLHGNFEVYVATDQSLEELAATLFHELVHTRMILHTFVRESPEEKEISSVQNEAKRNASL